ncbi:hypothetical protein ABIE79_010069 [Bradyrhizobium diazoefficiens]
MLDEAWLDQLRFTAVENIKVNGLAGIGAQNVALNAEKPDGTKIVIKLPKTTLGFHVQEIPPSVSQKPEYQLEPLNEKLKSLVGHPMLDKMCPDYDELYCKIIHLISTLGVPGFLLTNTSVDSIETLPFVLHSPALERRLNEFAEWPFDPDHPLSNMPRVNGDKYPISLLISHDYRDAWISESISALEALPEYNKELDANSLHMNPLIVWGAAALEGFFTNEEMPKVAAYLENAYGSFVERPDKVKLLGQLHAMASLLCQYLEGSPVERIVRLCAHCGLMFQVSNSEGEVVADGFKMLAGK